MFSFIGCISYSAFVECKCSCDVGLCSIADKKNLLFESLFRARTVNKGDTKSKVDLSHSSCLVLSLA